MTTATTTTRKPRPSTAPTGFSLVVAMGQGKHRHSYRVSPVPVPEGAEITRLIRFHKDDGTTYHVAEDPDGVLSCDCGSAIWRGDGISALCKHERVVRRLGGIFG